MYTWSTYEQIRPMAARRQGDEYGWALDQLRQRSGREIVEYGLMVFCQLALGLVLVAGTE